MAITVPGLDPNTTFNVIDYGADPTFTTDSTAAIQACINAALQKMADDQPNAAACTVYMPRGTYGIGSELVIDTAIDATNATTLKIIGEGMAQSRLRKMDGAWGGGLAMLRVNTDDPTDPDGTRQFIRGEFRDFGIIAQSDSGANVVDYGLLCETAMWSLFENLRITGYGKCGLGIDWNYSNRLVKVHCDRPSGAYAHGFVMPIRSQVNNDNTLIDCMALNNTGIGFWIHNGTSTRMYGCMAEKNEAAGVFINYMRGMSLDMYFESNAETGMTFTTLNGGSLTGSPWVVKADIVLNGASNRPTSYTDLTPTSDISTVYPTRGATIEAMSARRSAGDTYGIAFLSCVGTVIKNWESRYDYGPSFLFNGCQSMAYSVSVPSLDEFYTHNEQKLSNMIDFFSPDVNRSMPHSSNIHFEDSGRYPQRVWTADQMAQLSGTDGVWADTGLTFRGNPLYSLGDVSVGTGGNSRFVGIRLDTFLDECPELVGETCVLVCEWFLGANYNDVYSNKYNSNLQLQLGGSSYQNTNGAPNADSASVETTGTATGSTVTVADATGIAVGDFLTVNAADATGAGNPAAHFAQVTAISGLDLTISSAVPTDVVAAQPVITQKPRYAFVMRTNTVGGSTTGRLDLLFRRFLGQGNDKILVSRMWLQPFGKRWDTWSVTRQGNL